MKASSESELCATLISRILLFALLIGYRATSPAKTGEDRRPALLRHQLTSYIEPCSRRANAAATMTFMTSANKNGSNPNAKARCQLCVTIASQAIPEPNSTISATIPATRLRPKEATPCSETHPATYATTG